MDFACAPRVTKTNMLEHSNILLEYSNKLLEYSNNLLEYSNNWDQPSISAKRGSFDHFVLEYFGIVGMFQQNVGMFQQIVGIFQQNQILFQQQIIKIIPFGA